MNILFFEVLNNRQSLNVEALTKNKFIVDLNRNDIKKINIFLSNTKQLDTIKFTLNNNNYIISNISIEKNENYEINSYQQLLDPENIFDLRKTEK